MLGRDITKLFKSSTISTSCRSGDDEGGRGGSGDGDDEDEGEGEDGGADDAEGAGLADELSGGERAALTHDEGGDEGDEGDGNGESRLL